MPHDPAVVLTPMPQTHAKAATNFEMMVRLNFAQLEARVLLGGMKLPPDRQRELIRIDARLRELRISWLQSLAPSSVIQQGGLLTPVGRGRAGTQAPLPNGCDQQGD